MTILDKIVGTKRDEVAAARKLQPLDELEQLAVSAAPPRDFRGALNCSGSIRLIAEIKKASPSAKVIRPDFEPVTIGASMRSTEPHA